jgi:hypothetical protein
LSRVQGVVSSRVKSNLETVHKRPQKDVECHVSINSGHETKFVLVKERNRL